MWCHNRVHTVILFLCKVHVAGNHGDKRRVQEITQILILIGDLLLRFFSQIFLKAACM